MTHGWPNIQAQVREVTAREHLPEYCCPACNHVHTGPAGICVGCVCSIAYERAPVAPRITMTCRGCNGRGWCADGSGWARRCLACHGAGTMADNSHEEDV